VDEDVGGDSNDDSDDDEPLDGRFRKRQKPLRFRGGEATP
jgi:hypothetical protein